MTTYGEDITVLTHNVARLVALGPDQEPAADPRLILAARDAVLGSIRAAYFLAAGLPSRRRLSTDAATHPVHALGAALHDMARTEPDIGVAEVSGMHGGNALWARAAGAAVRLELHAQGLRGLTGEAAWTAVGDLARLSRAIPHLDDDLAARHLHQDAPAMAVLTDAVTHTRIQIAAEQVLHLAESGHRDEGILEMRPPAARPLIVRRPDQVPAGLERLAELLAAPPVLAVRDVVLSSDALLRVATATSVALQRTKEPALKQLAASLDQMREPLARISGQRRFVTSTTSPDMRLAVQSQVIADIRPSVVDAEPAVAVDISAAVCRSSGALGDALERTVMAGGLLVPSDEADRRPKTRYLWTTSRDVEHPRLAAALFAADGVKQSGVTAAARLLSARNALGLASPGERLAMAVSSASTNLTHALAARRPAPARRPTYPWEPWATASAIRTKP